MLTYPINLSNGPGTLQAFLPQPDPDALAMTAAALANTDGGAMVIGLDQRGVYTGPVDGAAVTRALRAAGALISPALTLDRWELVATPGGPAVAVRVRRGSRLHTLRDGQVMVRVGDKNHMLNGGEIRALLSHQSNGDFEADVVPGARPSDLDPARLADLMVRCGACSGDDLLSAMGAVTPRAEVTVAGMLLLGRDPQRWLPHSRARFIHYISADHAAFEQTVQGPLAQMVDDLWALIGAHRRTPANGDSTPDYPAAAAREALVNAVCHRDYRLRGQSVTVRLFPDRLEIASPGGLPGFLTTESLWTGGRFSRNPRLAWSLYQWGYSTTPGQGIMNMIAEMDGHGTRPPEIATGRDQVVVTLYGAGDPGANGHAAPDESRFTEYQRRALTYVRANGSLTFHELRALCPAVQPSVLQRDLRDLVAGGHLRKVGPRSGVYYILP
jgi:ATP-dependent DNA helicase RecG